MGARLKGKRPAAVLLFVLAWTSHAYGQEERLTDGQIAGVIFVANQAEIAIAESALRRTRSRSVQALATRIATEPAQVNQETITDAATGGKPATKCGERRIDETER
jgi:putative membrane protein